MMRIFVVAIAVGSLFGLPGSLSQDVGEEASFDFEFDEDLLDDEAFALEEGVWSDEFEDGRPSDAWFPYDPGYFNAINVASPNDPRNEELTIYDDPINAEELEGLLSIKGNLPPPGAAPEAAAVFDPQDLRRYKVITPDPIRGEFRAELKIALRGRTFGIAQINFFIREHDWKFDGAREARMVIYLTNPPDELTQVGYEANWNQAEYFNPLYRYLDIEAEDNVIVQLRRTEDNQIQLWTAEDDADLEFRARLGAPVETDLADILIAIQSTGLGTPDQMEGTVTIDSFTIRGPEVPDVEEGLEDQALLDLRDQLRSDYDQDVLGRFEYSDAAIAANRAYTWMHYYGTRFLYPPNLRLSVLPPPQAGGPQQNIQVEIDTLRGTKTATLGTALEDFFDAQPPQFPRGDRGYVDMAYAKYKQAAEMAGGTPYSIIASQVEWLHDVALERIIRIIMAFRGRGYHPTGVELEGFIERKVDFDVFAGFEPQLTPQDPGIRIFEGRLSPEAKSEVLAVPGPFAIFTLLSYFGLEAEIQTPVDLIGRIPFLFDPEWMTIPLTIYVPDISQETLARLGFFAQPGFLGPQGAGGFDPFNPQAQAGAVNLSGFQAIDPNLLIGRGYTVVEYYGKKYGFDEQIERDELGRLDPQGTAEKAFPYLRDFPGFVDIVTEIIDPDKHGSTILEWDFNFADLAQILTVPRSGNRVTGDQLSPPDPQSLYLESEIALLVNRDNPQAPRRYTFSDYFGWELGAAGTPVEPDRQGNRIAAFDSPILPITTELGQ